MLPLVELAPELGDGSVTELLRETEGELLGFFLSFAVIARLWLAQHADRQQPGPAGPGWW